MADKQSRASFIATLEEVAGIAESCGEFASQGVILALLGAIQNGHDFELLSVACEFSKREIEWIEAQRGQTTESGSV